MFVFFHCIEVAISSSVFGFIQQLSVITYSQSHLADLKDVTVHPMVLKVFMMSLCIHHNSALFWQENDMKHFYLFINFVLSCLRPLESNFDTVSFIACIFWNQIWSQRWRLDCNVLVDLRNRLLISHVKCRGAYLLRLFDILYFCSRMSDVCFQRNAYIRGLQCWKLKLPGSWANRRRKRQDGLFITLIIAGQQCKDSILKS